MPSDVRITTGQASFEKRRYRFAGHLPLPYFSKGPGIYAILNRNNGKIYIGSSGRINHRMTEHRTSLADGTHGNRYLRCAFEKSPADFYVEIVELRPNSTTEHLLAREQFWINFFKSYLPENGYNISPTASSCKGVKHTPESIARMSVNRRKPWSDETKAIAREKRKLNQPRGWKWTKDACDLQSLRRKGVKTKPLSLEHRAFLSTIHKKPVLQFTLCGRFVRRFDSILDAESFLGGKRTWIGDALKGRCRQALGFVWKYANDASESDCCPIRPRKPKGKHHAK